MSDLGNAIAAMMFLEVLFLIGVALVILGLGAWGLWAIFGPIGVCI